MGATHLVLLFLACVVLAALLGFCLDRTRRRPRDSLLSADSGRARRVAEYYIRVQESH